MSDDLRVSVVETDRDFLALRDEWNELVEADRRATIFQTWEFQYYAWRILAEAVSLRLVLVRDETDRLIGCAPLGTRAWRVGPFSGVMLGFACYRYSDYNDFILRSDRADDALAVLAKWFRENTGQWSIVRLTKVLSDSWARHEHSFLAEIGYPFRSEQSHTSPYLRIRNDWSSHEDALSGKSARALRYQVRRLFRRLGAGFHGTDDRLSLDRELNQLMDLHQRRMRQKRQRGLFADARSREGFRALMKGLAARDLAKVCAISCEERAIASICTFQFRGTVSHYNGGFDPAYSSLSPLKVLNALRITEAIEDGACEFDFLIGDEPYKHTWTNAERALYSLAIATGSWRAFPYEWWEALRTHLARSERVRAAYAWVHSNSARLKERIHGARVPPG